MFDNIRDADDYVQEFKELSQLLKKSGKNDRRVDQLVADMVADMQRLEQLLSKPLVLAVLEHVRGAEAVKDRLDGLEARINRI